MSKENQIREFNEKVERATFITIAYLESADEEMIMTLANEPEDRWDDILLTVCLDFYNQFRPFLCVSYGIQ